jgi:hypothetical protein
MITKIKNLKLKSKAPTARPQGLKPLRFGHGTARLKPWPDVRGLTLVQNRVRTKGRKDAGLKRLRNSGRSLPLSGQARRYIEFLVPDFSSARSLIGRFQRAQHAVPYEVCAGPMNEAKCSRPKRNFSAPGRWGKIVLELQAAKMPG